MRHVGVPSRRALLFALTLFGVAASSGCGYDDNQDYGSNPNPPAGNPTINSGPIATGGSFRYTFADSGAYSYHCTIHPCMAHGTVTVTAAGSDSAFVEVLTPGGACPGGYTPLTVSVKPGGSVRWLNQSVTHTVTSD